MATTDLAALGDEDMNQLRPCEAIRFYKGEAITVTGRFHGWFPDFEEFEAGPGNYTVALIEQDDGTVVACPMGTVKFLDRQIS